MEMYFMKHINVSFLRDCSFQRKKSEKKTKHFKHTINVLEVQFFIAVGYRWICTYKICSCKHRCHPSGKPFGEERCYRGNHNGRKSYNFRKKKLPYTQKCKKVIGNLTCWFAYKIFTHTYNMCVCPYMYAVCKPKYVHIAHTHMMCTYI